jgi:tRNA pseudouridine38-40 synthase
MMNYRLLLQYDGTGFHGWQIQANLRTVQGELTRVLSLLDNRDVTVHGSGRTDAGVHAAGQVANVHLQREISPDRLRSAINGNLEADVRVLSVEIVPDEFHARFSAIGKTYRYRVVNGYVMCPFWRLHALHESRKLDIEKMHRCGKLFIGEHDWTGFSAADSDAESRVRTLTELNVAQRADELSHSALIEFTVSADGFLRYMVRSIVGTLLAVGRNEIDEETVKRAIQEGNRSLAGPTAPAQGLTLMQVHY